MIPEFHGGDGAIVIPERRLEGTTDQQLQQLDDAIAALMGFRVWLASSQHAPDPPARRERLSETVRHLVRFSGAALITVGARCLS